MPGPVKSSCVCCPAVRTEEVERRSREECRVIVLMEARAKPRLRTIEGLWRKPVLGRGGATPRPGSMTEYIRDTGLLAPTEVDRIVRDAPTALVDFQRTQALLPVDERDTLGDRSEEHTSDLQSLMRISYAAFGLKKKKHPQKN